MLHHVGRQQNVEGLFFAGFQVFQGLFEAHNRVASKETPLFSNLP